MSDPTTSGELERVRPCLACGAFVPFRERVCPACGQQASEGPASVPRAPCPSCGEEVAGDLAFCPACGVERSDWPEVEGSFETARVADDAGPLPWISLGLVLLGPAVLAAATLVVYAF